MAGILYGGDSDWSTSGANIWRETGKVGIGAAPTTNEKFVIDLAASEFKMTKYAGSNGFKHSATAGDTQLMNMRGYTNHIQLTTQAGGGLYVVGQGSGAGSYLGVGVNDPDHPLEIYKDGAQLKLSYDAANHCVFSVAANGNMDIAPSGTEISITGDLRILDPNDTGKIVARIYDSSDDGLIAGYANNVETVLIHANGDSLLNGGSLGIGGSPNASALLDVTSTTKGFLPPRMTDTQRDAIGSPAAGLVIFSTDQNALQFYDGSAWKQISFVSAP